MQNLLQDLKSCNAVSFKVILTLNIPEQLPFDPAAFPFPVRVLRNAAPRGFGANHNAAFAASEERFFCVLNPDIRLPLDPFPALLSKLENPAIAAAAPLIRNPSGDIEDHARPFPTLPSLVLKLLKKEEAIGKSSSPFTPDWIAGMFMLFRREAFAAAGGFDEGYFMYYEDVDLCARLRAAGMRVEVSPAASAVHDARRSSRRNPRHMLWHACSMARFLFKRWMRKA